MAGKDVWTATWRRWRTGLKREFLRDPNVILFDRLADQRPAAEAHARANS
jgi:hypothetical protein